MLKPLIFLFFSLFISLAASAQAQDISQLMGVWGEGEIDAQNNVVKLGPRMGGPVSFSLGSDSVVSYSTGFNCGFGGSYNGIWTVNPQDSILTFNFQTYQGVRDGTSQKTVEYQRVYQIIKLNTKDLIIQEVEAGSSRIGLMRYPPRSE
jgi:hypothetical protein